MAHWKYLLCAYIKALRDINDVCGADYKNRHIVKISLNNTVLLDAEISIQIGYYISEMAGMLVILR